jgi:hypothetical protein
MTTFEQVQQQIATGQVTAPKVFYGEGEIPFIGYQLAVHVFNLKGMALGLKFRGITFTQIKKYYGLTGRSAKDCILQLEEIQKKFRNG